MLSKCRNLDLLYVIEQMGIAILKPIHIGKVDHRFQEFYPEKQYLFCILNTWPLGYQSHKSIEDKIIKGIWRFLSYPTEAIPSSNETLYSSKQFFQTVHWLSTFYLSREDQGQRWLFYSILLFCSIFCQVTEY